MKRIIAIILALVMALAAFSACGSTADGNETTATTANTATAANTEDDAKACEEAAMKTENFTFTTAQLSYIYYSSAKSLLYYASSYGIDTEKSLKEQDCSFSEGMTWYDYLMDGAKTTASQILSVCEAAKARGVELGDEENTNIEESMESLKTAVDEYNTENSTSLTVNQYIEENLAKGVNSEDLRGFMELYALANKYLNTVVDETDVSTEVLEAYYEENADTLGEKDEARMSNVRHILFSKDTYEDDSKAQEIYNAWVAAGADVEEFKALVTKYTGDESSKDSGGLYEGVTRESSYVEPFLNWIFEDGRQVGDHGIVETDYGWHIMYLDSMEGEPFWVETAKNALLDEVYSNAVAEASDTYTVETFDDIINTIGD